MAVADRLAAIEAVPYSRRPAYAGVPFADALQEELARVRLVPSPVGQYGVADFDGEYTNVADGERSTLAPSCACPHTELWLTGGSATFGMGQRDSHTTASELVRLAERDSVALTVHNLAVPGWTLWQEYQGVLARLVSGATRPDAVVFVDGYNDTVGTVVSGVVNGPQPDGPTVLDADDVTRFIESLEESGRTVDGRTLGRVAARRYESLRAVIERQLSDLGIHVSYFFQPDALTSPVQRAPVDELYRSIPLLHRRADLDAALETASTALVPEVHDLRHLMDGQPRAVFSDAVHTNEEGARLVAEAVYGVVGAELRSRAR
jgi:lysophospholipase L1-like esterase